MGRGGIHLEFWFVLSSGLESGVVLLSSGVLVCHRRGIHLEFWFVLSSGIRIWSGAFVIWSFSAFYLACGHRDRAFWFVTGGD
jgi:hypothetical protein